MCFFTKFNAIAQNSNTLTAGASRQLIEYLNLDITVESKDIDKLEASLEPEYIEYDVPTNNSFKSYMDAKYISAKSSAQYKLKSKYELDNAGIYKVDDRYCIAVGSYYCTDIGTRIDLVMKNGSVIECILADCKANKDTDSTNRQNPNGSIIEFVVCEKWLLPEIKRMGDCSYASDVLFGEIAAIRVYQR